MVDAISTVDLAGLRAVLDSLGAPAWRAQQIREAVWRPDVATFDDVRQLPAGLRSDLAARFPFMAVANARESEADGGRTVKLVARLFDGQTIETVAMETPSTSISRRRSTICVSSQVGCAIGCPFCATGQMGLRRNCTAAEIVDQVRLAGSVLHAREQGPVTHVVFMGMGEPLANLENVLTALRVLTRDGGISARRITVSTSGIIPGITALRDAGMPVTLAISLHAATDELRTRLVPVNKAHPLADLIASARDYATTTGRRVTLEWCLIGGVNDSEEQAIALRDIAADLRAHVNVIPMNHIDGSPWGPPTRAVTDAFLEQLRGVRTTVRDTRGGDTDAACGQLRADLERRRMLRPDGTLGPPIATKPIPLTASDSAQPTEPA